MTQTWMIGRTHTIQTMIPTSMVTQSYLDALTRAASYLWRFQETPASASRFTWPEQAVRRIVAAQDEGLIGEEFGMKDLNRIFPECPEWILSDHCRGNPEGRSIWFIRKSRGRYSVARNASVSLRGSTEQG